MDTYEITPEQITEWALQYASFEDLETAAKSLYAIYGQERKRDYPEVHKANRAAYRKRKRANK